MQRDDVFRLVRVGGEIKEQGLWDIRSREARVGCVRATAHASRFHLLGSRDVFPITLPKGKSTNAVQYGVVAKVFFSSYPTTQRINRDYLERYLL